MRGREGGYLGILVGDIFDHDCGAVVETSFNPLEDDFVFFGHIGADASGDGGKCIDTGCGH